MLKDLSLKQIFGANAAKYQPLRGAAIEQTTAAGRSTPSKRVVPLEVEDRTLACRYEMKYVISEAKALAIEKFVSMYIKMDHYSRIREGGFYPITSLYLDSPTLTLCRESMLGQKNRYKLRVRSYDENPDSYCFCEIKRRINTVIIKSRARIKKPDMTDVLCGRGLRSPQNYITDENALRQFQMYMAGVRARPAVHIRYMRKAYEADSDNRVRVTFDRQLCYKMADKAELVLNGPGWRRNSVGGVVLEIKFTGRYPVWLKQMAECFCLNQQSMSKYATSVKTACFLGFCAPKMPISL